jgi:flagellar motor switch protein FliG
MSSTKTTSNLKRFKNSSQGLKEFAVIIEQSDPKSRELILSAAEKEDPRFVANAMRQVIFFEEMVFLDETLLAEILSKVSPKLLAFAMHKMAEDFRNTLTKQLGYREKKQLQEEESRMSTSELSESFVLGAQRQVLKMARDLEKQGKFIMEIADCPRFHKKKAA